MKVIVGIDVGLKGCIAYLSENGDLEILNNPIVGNDVDALEFYSIINKHKPDKIFMERPQPRPDQNCRAAITSGKNYGIMLACVQVSRIPLVVMDCSTWQSWAFIGVPSHLPPKDKSAMAAKRLFPKYDFRDTERCRKPHDGKTDAALIAAWGILNS